MEKSIFNKIYNQYGHEIRRHIYYRSGDEEISNDITQETFIKIWQNNYTYHESKIRALLYKIAIELFLDYLRKQKTKTDYLSSLEFQLKSNSSFHPEDEDELDQERLKQCESALEVLSEKERIVFLMNKVDGYTQKEIADLLNISIKTVEKRIKIAKDKLSTRI